MTDKEKAIAYDKAINRAINHRNHDGLTLEQYDTIEVIFPELAESEDEKTRKELIQFIKNWKDPNNIGRPHDFSTLTRNVEQCDRYIAWLEKQGDKSQGKTALEAIHEEKVDNAIKVEPTFKVGDWITFYGDKPFKILKVESEQNGILDYLLLSQNGHDSYYNKKYVDENARLWTIQDAKDGDVLVDVYGNIGIFDKCYDFDWMSCCSLGNNGGFQYFTVEHENEKTYPATKEQRELLFQKIKEAGWEWDADKKELKRLENQTLKSKWTDDDEQYLLVCKNALHKYQVSDKWDADIISKWLEDKLKQGEQKSKWSEEDDYNVHCCIAKAESDIANGCTGRNKELIDWLKSLKQRIGE